VHKRKTKNFVPLCRTGLAFAGKVFEERRYGSFGSGRSSGIVFKHIAAGAFKISKVGTRPALQTALQNLTW